MARSPSLWWRKSHSAWFTTIAGQQINLGSDKAAATRTFHGLLSQASPEIITPSRLTVAKLADLWLSHKAAKLAPKTWRSYQEYAQSLIDSCGRVPVCQLKPFHITRWIEQHPWTPAVGKQRARGWNQSTQHLAISVAKMITAWGLHEGLIDRDSIKTVKRPGIGRRAPTSQANFTRLLDGVRSAAFLQLLTLALETGCRPGELRSLTAASIAPDGQTATVRGKTGLRLVYLSERAQAILGPLRLLYPAGPLLRNVRGREWTERAVQNSFERAGKRAGVHVTAYQIRGLFASLALRRGVDSLFVARLLGHQDGGAMLSKHYAHVESDQLSAALARATDSGAAHPPSNPSPNSDTIADTPLRLAPDTAQLPDADRDDTAADPPRKSSARKIR